MIMTYAHNYCSLLFFLFFAFIARCRAEQHCSEHAESTHAEETGHSGPLPAGGGRGSC